MSGDYSMHSEIRWFACHAELRLRGRLDVTAAVESLAGLFAEAEKRGWRGVLIDLVGLEETPTAEHALMGALGLARKWRPGWRLASLHAPEARNAAKFFESTALNRGMTSRVFTEREDALRWLLGSEAEAALADSREDEETTPDSA